MELMLAGLSLPVTANDDRQYLVDLGLLKRPQGGGLVVANPIIGKCYFDVRKHYPSKRDW
ncbi:hypothetical protein QGP82_29405 [Leptothoe sp. LEGE 181152]|nr:hypothetical protein [Leptothoe sp. LEGE 181152]